MSLGDLLAVALPGAPDTLLGRQGEKAALSLSPPSFPGGELILLLLLLLRCTKLLLLITEYYLQQSRAADDTQGSREPTHGLESPYPFRYKTNSTLPCMCHVPCTEYLPALLLLESAGWAGGRAAGRRREEGLVLVWM